MRAQFCHAHSFSRTWECTALQMNVDLLQTTLSFLQGVGSKLMAAMGYKPGDGLGKASQGRVEPVPILKLPPGRLSATISSI